MALVTSWRTAVLLLGTYSFGVDVLAQSCLALLLKLLDVADQPCIAVDLELFVLLYLFLSLLLLVDVLVYQLIYLCNVRWGHLSLALTPIQLVTQPRCNFDGPRVQEANVALVGHLVLACLHARPYASFLHPLGGLDIQRLLRSDSQKVLLDQLKLGDPHRLQKIFRGLTDGRLHPLLPTPAASFLNLPLGQV